MPLLSESKQLDDRYNQYFKNDFGRDRSYRMPGTTNVSSTDDMKLYIRDYFPLVDMPQLFGLHETATIKYTTDLAADILHRTYIYQFVVKKPKKVVIN